MRYRMAVCRTQTLRLVVEVEANSVEEAIMLHGGSKLAALDFSGALAGEPETCIMGFEPVPSDPREPAFPSPPGPASDDDPEQPPPAADEVQPAPSPVPQAPPGDQPGPPPAVP